MSTVSLSLQHVWPSVFRAVLWLSPFLAACMQAPRQLSGSTLREHSASLCTLAGQRVFNLMQFDQPPRFFPEGRRGQPLSCGDVRQFHNFELRSQTQQRVAFDDRVADLGFCPEAARPNVGPRAVNDVPVLHPGLQASGAIRVTKYAVGHRRLDSNFHSALYGPRPASQRKIGGIPHRQQDHVTALDSAVLSRIESIVEHRSVIDLMLFQPRVKRFGLHAIGAERGTRSDLESASLYYNIELIFCLPVAHIRIGDRNADECRNLVLEPLDIRVLGIGVDVVIQENQGTCTVLPGNFDSNQRGRLTAREADDMVCQLY